MTPDDAADVGAPPIINVPHRFWGGFGDDVRALLAERELLRSLVAREVRQRYKGAFFGWGWALARPLVMLAVYGLAVGVFLGANKTVPQFAIYLYTGLIVWNFFATIITGSIAALPANAGLIGRAPFRKELLVVAVVVVATLDLLIQGAMLILAYIAFGAWPAPASLWWLIPALLMTALLGLALGLLLSAANVFYRDVGYFAEVVLQVGFWLVPILYAYSMVQTALADWPLMLDLYTANPMVPAIAMSRLALWPAGSTETGQQLLGSDVVLGGVPVMIVILLGAVFLAQRFFSRVSGSLAQEL